jgi:carbamoyltransferase
MYILGISCFYHDAAAALLKDGRLIAASEEERFTRIKHDFSFPSQAVAFCLDHAGISASDLDYIVFYEKPFHKFERILMTTLQGFPKSWKIFRESMITWLGDKLWVKSIIKDKLGVQEDKILFGEHHLSHAASAFYPSPFDKAAILTVDGVGEWTTTSMGIGEGSSINLLNEIKFPHSLGLLYSAFTAFLGFRVNS